MTNNEEQVMQDLVQEFAFLAGHVRAQRARRIWVETPPETFDKVLDYLAHKQDFTILLTITGLDLGDKLGAIYHLARKEGMVLNLKVAIPKDKPAWKTVIGLYPNCANYERELVDLLGFQVEGLPPGSRYPLPDDWPAGQYPLRKDWHDPAAAATGKEEQP
jgi:membrane-bound hydrogenase subunit beta